MAFSDIKILWMCTKTSTSSRLTIYLVRLLLNIGVLFYGNNNDLFGECFTLTTSSHSQHSVPGVTMA